MCSRWIILTDFEETSAGLPASKISNIKYTIATAPISSIERLTCFLRKSILSVWPARAELFGVEDDFDFLPILWPVNASYHSEII